MTPLPEQDTQPAPPPAPLAHPPGGQPSRPLGVALLAILGFVGGGVAAAAGALVMIAGAALVTDQQNRLFGALLLFVGPVLAFAGTLQIVVALGLWRGRSWAWTLQIILLALLALLALAAHHPAARLPGLAVTCLVGWYFCTPAVRAYFGPTRDHVSGRDRRESASR